MNDKKIVPKKSFSHSTIFLGITLAILFLDSVMILLSGIKKGIFKKEILSKKSNIGFDFKIIIK